MGTGEATTTDPWVGRLSTLGPRPRGRAGRLARPAVALRPQPGESSRGTLPRHRSRGRRRRLPGDRRRARRDRRQARRFPRREPVHDLGVQVRVARGRQQVGPPLLAQRTCLGRRHRHLGSAARSVRSRPGTRGRVARHDGRAAASAIDEPLTDHQRTLFVSIVLKGVPLDALAAELGSNRNAIYKSLFDARRKLRACLVADGYLDGNEHGRRT